MAELLHDRRVISVTGPQAAEFLQGLVTADINQVGSTAARAAALLTPQGKVLFDFLIVALNDAGGFALDCHREVADDLARRLTFYRLRAKVDIAVSGLGVLWSGDAGLAGGFADPRHPSLGHRVLTDSPAEQDLGADAYHQRRIAAGIAEAVHDFASGAVFPHEANFDLLGGVSFSKGCYIGQEVVSRTHHRGTTRKRFFCCRITGPLPPMGAEIVAGGRTVGIAGSGGGDRVMALLRLDAVAASSRGYLKLMAGDTALSPEIPPWMADIDAFKTSGESQ